MTRSNEGDSSASHAQQRDGGRLLRLGTLALLYFVQGAPYGFQVSCLPLILRSSASLSFTQLGAMKLLFLPWVLKPLYAQFIEDSKSKQWWLNTTMAAMAITCIVAAMGASETDLPSLSVLLLMLNLFSACQDVATDSLAVRVLRPEEVGAGNTVQVVAYKAGSVFAGGLLLYVADVFGWAAMFVSFGAVYVVCIVMLSRLNLVEKSSAGSAKEDHGKVSNESTTSSLRRVFSVRGTVFLVCFVSFYKLCERAEQTFSLFMVDKGVPKTTMALWATLLRTASLLGSTYGGYALSSSSEAVTAKAKQIVVGYSALRAVPIVVQYLVVKSWGHAVVSEHELSSWTSDSVHMYVGFGCTAVTLFCAGVVTTATFTLMMRLSQSRAPKDIQGPHYTTLATFEVLGKLAFASIAGGLTDYFGLEFMFIVFAVLAVLTVPFARAIPEERGSLVEEDEKSQ